MFVQHQQKNGGVCRLGMVHEFFLFGFCFITLRKNTYYGWGWLVWTEQAVHDENVLAG